MPNLEKKPSPSGKTRINHPAADQPLVRHDGARRMAREVWQWL
jgi:hypothetical protein